MRAACPGCVEMSYSWCSLAGVTSHEIAGLGYANCNYPAWEPVSGIPTVIINVYISMLGHLHARCASEECRVKPCVRPWLTAARPHALRTLGCRPAEVALAGGAGRPWLLGLLGAPLPRPGGPLREGHRVRKVTGRGSAGPAFRDRGRGETGFGGDQIM